MIYTFGEFELDTQLFELRRRGEICALQPQVFNVLRYLLEHADHVVTKNELLENLWPGRVVSESALTSRLKTARQIIGDSGNEQRFIKTLHGRGYRFVGAFATRDERSAPGGRAGAAVEPRAEGRVATAPTGRAAELAELQRELDRAERGELRTVFVSGEAGVGKTVLIEAFLDSVRASGRAESCVGQCIELGAAAEAYMPLLDALHGLCLGPAGVAARAVLREVAPSWLMQLPGLLTPEDRAEIDARVIGVTQERMLREFAAAARVLSAETPLVIALEDLHWGDPSTLALISWLARRKDALRVLIVATHRPAETSGRGHSLTETVYGLRLRGLARVIALSALGPSEIREYLERRCPGCEFPAEVLAMLYRRTDGNPLFLGSIVESWLDKGLLVRSGEAWTLDTQRSGALDILPETLRALVAEQCAGRGERDRRILAAASVAGPRFSAALVEAVLGEDCEHCEQALAALGEQTGLIARDGDAHWPDATIASRFRFRHTLYRDAIYADVPAGRRARMHLQIAERLERAFGDSASEHSTELASHFAAGGNYDKAVTHRLGATQLAFSRGGYREAIEHIESALVLLETNPDLPDHESRELGFQVLLAQALIQVRGWAEPRTEATLERALVLAERRDDPRLSSVLYVLAAVHELRGEYTESQRFLERQRSLPKPFETPLAELESHELLACSTYHQGAFSEALAHAEAGIVAGGAFDIRSKLYVYGENPRVSCHNWAGLALWFLGFPDRSLERIREGLALARVPARKYSLSNALCQAATLHQLRREPDCVLELAEEAIAVALEEGFTYPLAIGRILKGWALAVTGRAADGIALIEQGLEGHRATGAHMDRPYYLSLLAEAQAAASDWTRARATIADALARIDNDRRFFYEAELLRLQAQFALLDPDAEPDAIRPLLERSIEAARRQNNRIVELRAEYVLAVTDRDARERDRHVSALEELFGSFTEGHDTRDLVDVRDLLSGSLQESSKK